MTLLYLKFRTELLIMDHCLNWAATIRNFCHTSMVYITFHKGARSYLEGWHWSVPYSKFYIFSCISLDFFSEALKFLTHFEQWNLKLPISNLENIIWTYQITYYFSCIKSQLVTFDLDNLKKKTCSKNVDLSFRFPSEMKVFLEMKYGISFFHQENRSR